MKSKWKASEAKNYIKKYKKYGEDIALRTYTAQLIGREPTMVLHGGGNTSVKTTLKDITGESVEVLCVKGSGWDLETIEPEGHPAIRIEPLLKLKQLKSLSDEAMVNAQRINMLDSKGPNPSIETLLHAFLPHKFIDHSHADAILSVVNNSKGQRAIKELVGEKLGLVPYVMPGFDLSKLAAKIYLKNPAVEGLVLMKHGLFTFGETAKESYERMIYWVDKAESFLQKSSKKVFSAPTIKTSLQATEIAHLSNLLRGLLSVDSKSKDRSSTKHLETKKKMIIRFRTSNNILKFVSSKESKTLSQIGPPTPDHVIRTKQYPLYIPYRKGDSLLTLKTTIDKELTLYKQRYNVYVNKYKQKKSQVIDPLDPLPRIIIMPGYGLFSAGADVKAAEIALDIYEHTIDVIEKASFLGQYQVLSESDLFDMEYWSLEQAKLGKSKELPFQRQIVWISGAASGIGLATAKAFHELGANVYLTDINKKALEQVVHTIGGVSVAYSVCDVTKEQQVINSFERCTKAFGGVDIVISNAGNAPSNPIDTLSDSDLRKSFDVNFFSHQYVAKTASAIFKRQGLGGVLLFNASKSAFNQGPDFGPYAIPKAAVISLMKQYAIELGRHGVRSNAINADRILTGLFAQGLLEKRAKARNLTPKDYLAGNLLQEEVYAEDVAQGFIYLAKARKTTGAILTIDGGNAAAFPR